MKTNITVLSILLSILISAVYVSTITRLSPHILSTKEVVSCAILIEVYVLVTILIIYIIIDECIKYYSTKNTSLVEKENATIKDGLNILINTQKEFKKQGTKPSRYTREYETVESYLHAMKYFNKGDTCRVKNRVYLAEVDESYPNKFLHFHVKDLKELISLEGLYKPEDKVYIKSLNITVIVSELRDEFLNVTKGEKFYYRMLDSY